MDNGAVSGLQFSWRELAAEIEAIRSMSGDLLYGDGELIDLKKQVERIGRKAFRDDVFLELRPLRTRPSRGYESGSCSGGLEVYALVTGKWRVRPVGIRGSRRIAFTGLASTRIELWPVAALCEEESDISRRLAMWRVEIGAEDSPGCYFHFQVLGDGSSPPFPEILPIPRFPSPFVTPMAAVEFSLGELFQNEWSRRVSMATSDHKRWRSIQRDRWTRLLQWQSSVVEGSASSPWVDLKEAKPPNGLFVRA